MIRLWPRREESAVNRGEAKAAIEQAVEIRTQNEVLAQRWEHHLHTNGFAEMVESIFMKDNR